MILQTEYVLLCLHEVSLRLPKLLLSLIKVHTKLSALVLTLCTHRVHSVDHIRPCIRFRIQSFFSGDVWGTRFGSFMVLELSAYRIDFETGLFDLLMEVCVVISAYRQLSHIL